jgi:hypothetical protein
MAVTDMSAPVAAAAPAAAQGFRSRDRFTTPEEEMLKKQQG